MIQRKQSLYLLLSLAIMAVMFFINIASICGPEHILEMRFYGILDATPNASAAESTIIWPLLVMCVMPTLLTFMAIFLYKNRPLQMKVTGIAAALQLGLAIFLNVTHFMVASDIEYKWVFSAYTLLPLIAAVFSYLAYRRISDDEALIKSLNRLR